MQSTCFVTPLITRTGLFGSVPNVNSTPSGQPRRQFTHVQCCHQRAHSTAYPSIFAPQTQQSANESITQSDDDDDSPSSTLTELTIHEESLTLLEWPAITAKVLTFASTTMGRRILVDPSHPQHLRIPPTRSESEHLLALTREANRAEIDLATTLSLSGAADITPLVAAAAKGRVLFGPDLRAVASTLTAARELRRSISAHGPDSLPLLYGLLEVTVQSGTHEKQQEQSPSLLSPSAVVAAERELLRCIDEYGDVVESADSTLSTIRDNQRALAADARAELNKLMSRHAAAMQERVITTRYDRLVIPVKTSHKAVFRRAVVHDASATGSTTFLEPQSVRPLNDRLRALAAKERAAVHAILKRLSEEVVAPLDLGMAVLCDALATIDAAAARARCSRTYEGVDFAFDDSKPLNLLGVRHPLLAWKEMDDTNSTEEDGNFNSGDADNGTQQATGKPKGANGQSSFQSRENTAARTRADEQLGLTTVVREFVKQNEPRWKRAVVPSSYTLPEGARCVCVTGPNTGGKTISLKTLGVVALLARAGLFLPASPPRLQILRPAPDVEKKISGNLDPEAELGDMTNKVSLPYFDAVLADIGDDQSLVQSLSTFSGHVQRIKRILSATTGQSLVLLDEIGSGTDPAEGAALGISILRYLAVEKRASLTFATTHHGELKTLKYATDGTGTFFENASVEFDDVALAPTFRLVWGVPGRSNALSIARRLGLHSGVIDEAEDVLRGGDEDSDGCKIDLESMIVALEADKRAAEDARRGAEEALAEISGRRDELADRLARLREGEATLRKGQKAAMEAEVAGAKKQIAKMIRDMQKGGGSAQAAARAADKLAALPMPGAVVMGKNDEKRESASDRLKGDEIRVGDRVTVSRIGANDVQVVEVVSTREVIVAIGAMRAKVKVRDIDGYSKAPTGREKRHEVEEKKSTQKKSMGVRTAANTIDIRGDRVDSAEVKVDSAIDRALAVGMLWVVHGHGTGRLRDGIRNFLREHPLVASIKDADRHDGGTGCTVVHLK